MSRNGYVASEDNSAYGLVSWRRNGIPLGVNAVIRLIVNLQEVKWIDILRPALKSI